MNMQFLWLSNFYVYESWNREHVGRGEEGRARKEKAKSQWDVK